MPEHEDRGKVLLVALSAEGCRGEVREKASSLKKLENRSSHA